MGWLDMNALLGNRIKALRNMNKLTQEQVADQVGISRQKYVRIENGTNRITLDILSKVSEVLGITVGDITNVLDKDGENNTSSKIFDMLDLFTQISICMKNCSLSIGKINGIGSNKL